MSTRAFAEQYQIEQIAYLAGADFYTWVRHFHVVKDLSHALPPKVLEVGTGDGVVRRCLLPFVQSYTVFDINERLRPDVVGDLLVPQPALEGAFDAVVCTEVLEHLPFEQLQLALQRLASFLRPGAKLYLTLPHRKGHALLVTPRQRLIKFRFPVGLTSLSEAWNRFVRRRIWIDPHHCWEIGDGRIGRADVELRLSAAGLQRVAFTELPYCDYWVLDKPEQGRS